MLPIKFTESNESYIVGGKLEVPIYEDNLQTIVCYQFNKEEMDMFFRTGRLWLRIPGGVKATGWPAPFVTMTVYNPFKKMEPLRVKENIVNKVIIHNEDDEELILYKIEKGSILNVTTDFVDKVKLLGHATELPEYAEAVKLYNLDPNYVYILKRVRDE